MTTIEVEDDDVIFKSLDVVYQGSRCVGHHVTKVSLKRLIREVLNEPAKFSGDVAELGGRITVSDEYADD